MAELIEKLREDRNQWVEVSTRVTSDYSNSALLGGDMKKEKFEWPLVKNVVQRISALGEWLSYMTSKKAFFQLQDAMNSKPESYVLYPLNKTSFVSV